MDDGKQDRDIACCAEDLEARRYERRYLFKCSVDLAGVRYAHFERVDCVAIVAVVLDIVKRKSMD